LTPIYA
jgi:hypothetical protein